MRFLFELFPPQQVIQKDRLNQYGKTCRKRYLVSYLLYYDPADRVNKLKKKRPTAKVVGNPIFH